MRVKDIDVKARWFAGKGRRVVDVATVDSLGPLTIARVRYEDGTAEAYLLFEDVNWGALLASVAGSPLDGRSGRLELRGSVPLDEAAGSRVPSTDQTNTLLVLQERVLVKAYRRLQAGAHPEVELMAALTAAEGPVPRYFGSLHYTADGEDTAVALLCEFVAGAEDGWERPVERVVEWMRDGGTAPVAEYRAAGEAAARLHTCLAGALPVRRADSRDAAAALAVAVEALDAAAHADAELAGDSARVRAGLSALERLEGAPLQRIHGDLHHAQFLRRAAAEPLVIDFEGDPTRPLAERRRLGSPLYDLACLLRSIDHIGSAAAKRTGGEAPDPWIAAATDAALAGYGSDVDRSLLRALELAKEVGEFVYAQQMLPAWTYAPRAGLARLLAHMDET